MALSPRSRTTLSSRMIPKASVLLTQEEAVLLIRALEDLIGDDTTHIDPDSVLAHQLTSRLYNVASSLIKPLEKAN